MGELGAFLKIHRVGFDKRDPRQRVGDYKPVLRAAARGGASPPGRALHGLRRAVLPRGLPAGQPHPRLERPRLPRQVARGDRAAARDQQLPRVHRADLPGAVRVGVRAGDQRRSGDDRADRAGDHRAGLRRRAGSCPSRPIAAPVARSRSSAPGPAGLAVAAELNKCGHTRHRLRARRGARAACCASACPTPSSRSGSSTAASALLEEEGIEFVYDTEVGTRRRRAAELQERYDAVVLAIGSRVSRAWRSEGAHLDGIHPAMDYLYQRNRWVAASQGRPSRAPAGRRDRRSPPRARR